MNPEYSGLILEGLTTKLPEKHRQALELLARLRVEVVSRVTGGDWHLAIGKNSAYDALRQRGYEWTGDFWGKPGKVSLPERDSAAAAK